MGNSATGGCCCFGCDVTPDVPENIIPDPEDGQPCEFTIQRCGWGGFSRDYQAFRGLDDPVEENRWLFLNKSGSTFGGDCVIAIENFVRVKEDKPKEGEILWKAEFVDTPYFQQYLRNPAQAGIEMMMNEMLDSGFGGFMGRGNLWQNDSYYNNRGGGADRDYVCTLVINWTLDTHAILSSENRKGYGCDLKLGVFACGTAVARYFEVEEPIRNAEGEITGYRQRWEKHVEEFVDQVQFSLVTGNAGPGWQAGQLLALPDGSPATWSLPGNASDWTNNYPTPYFEVRQSGGWFSKDPKRILTPACLDPALCLLIGHLGTSEYSSAGIKEALHPDFPYDPRGAIIFGMLNQAPPPPPVIIVQQPYMVQYATAQQAYAPMGGMAAPMPMQMQQPMMQQPMAQAMPMQPGGMQMQPGGMQMQPMGGAPPSMDSMGSMSSYGSQESMSYDDNYDARQEAEADGDDVTIRLQKLKKMKDQGLIDDADYERKKDELLERL